MKGSVVWQNIVAVLVSASFVAANMGYGQALRLWENGATAILVYFGLGVGMKMGQRSFDNLVASKYGEIKKEDKEN